jgi:hypothetical protein
MSEDKMHFYEDRYVTFVELLGFKNRVERAARRAVVHQ